MRVIGLHFLFVYQMRAALVRALVLMVAVPGMHTIRMAVSGRGWRVFLDD